MKKWQLGLGRELAFCAMATGQFDLQVGSAQEGLPAGIMTAQGIETKLTGERVEFGAHEAVRPVGVDRDGAFQEAHLAAVVGSTQEKDPRLGGHQRRGGGEGQPWRSGITARGVLGAVGLNELGGAAPQRRDGAMVPALPHPVLPEVVEAFHFGLEARFAWGHEDRHHAQAQAEVDDAAEAIRVAVRAVKAGIVVELRVMGTAKGSPVFGQATEDVGGFERSVQPSGGQAAVERDGIEGFDFGPVADDQAFDKVKGIQFACPSAKAGRYQPGGGGGRRRRVRWT